jgi:hypothetical protein
VPPPELTTWLYEHTHMGCTMEPDDPKFEGAYRTNQRLIRECWRCGDRCPDHRGIVLSWVRGL